MCQFLKREYRLQSNGKHEQHADKTEGRCEYEGEPGSSGPASKAENGTDQDAY